MKKSLLLPLFLSALLLSGCPSTTAPASRITPPNKIVPPKQPLAHHQILARIFDLAELQKTDRYGDSITPELIERYFGKPDREFKKWDDGSFSSIFGQHSPNPEDKGTVVVISVTRDNEPGTCGNGKISPRTRPGYTAHIQNLADRQYALLRTLVWLRIPRILPPRPLHA